MARTTADELALAQAIDTARRFGRRSILLAGIGLFAISALSMLTAMMPGSVTASSGVAGAVFVVPLLHVVGILFAAAGLFGSPSRTRPAIGLVLNTILIAASGQIGAAVAGSFSA